jgi:hypothetical protein
MRLHRAFLLAVVVPCGACATGGGGGGAADALVNVAIAGAVAGVRRSQGDCYSPCAPGTACNNATGFCEPLPCRGLCRPDERCEQLGKVERCINDRISPDLQLLQPIRGHPESDVPRAPPPTAP